MMQTLDHDETKTASPRITTLDAPGVTITITLRDPPPAVVVSPGTVKLPGMLSRVLALLSRDIPRDGPWIAVKLKAPYSTVRSALSTLVTFGYVSRVRGEGYIRGPLEISQPTPPPTESLS